MEDKSNKEEANKEGKKEIDRYERIVDRAHKEIEGVRSVYKWLISVVGILLMLGGYLTWDSLSGFRTELRGLRTEVETRVDKELSKEPIQKLIRERVSDQVDNVADKLIGEKINEKVTPLIRDVEIKVGDLQSQLVATEEKVNQIMAASEKKLRVLEGDTEKNLKAIQTESEFLLTVLRAQNGDKKSWFTLLKIAEKGQDTELGRFAADAAKRIYDDFFKTGLVEHKYYLPKISDSEVVEKLKNDWPHERKTAVYTIKERSMYEQIPILISMVTGEENLDVLGEIYGVLNELLGTDIKITDDKNVLRFEEAWEAKKKQLEETKGDKK